MKRKLVGEKYPKQSKRKRKMAYNSKKKKIEMSKIPLGWHEASTYMRIQSIAVLTKQYAKKWGLKGV